MSIAVVTGDLVKSRSYDAAARRKVQKSLLRSWEAVAKHFEKYLISDFEFRITAGDEFQYVCKDAASALDSLTLLRILLRQVDVHPRVTLRISVGIGERTVRGTRDPYSQDGSAFRSAREGMERLKKTGVLTAIISEKDDSATALANRLLPLCDLIYHKWTTAQANVLQHAALGEGVVKIADRLGLSKGTVSLNLKRAAWEEYRMAAAGISGLFAK